MSIGERLHKNGTTLSKRGGVVYTLQRLPSRSRRRALNQKKVNKSVLLCAECPTQNSEESEQSKNCINLPEVSKNISCLDHAVDHGPLLIVREEGTRSDDRAPLSWSYLLLEISQFVDASCVTTVPFSSEQSE